MDVKELRIGNLVKDDECIIVVVEALSGDNALVNGYGENEVLFSKHDYPNVLFESEIYPIALNDEILLKISSRCINSYFFNKDIEFYIVRIWNLYEVKIGGITLRQIKYIHELQNIYFILTGKELDVSQLTNN